ncbi:MAG: FadR/GntR family transcriptional regulator [Polyangiaceae bacterium]|jgi:GntR family transcriptional regulator, transcriptional repressor for pyruvate dehydrogenase complex
MSLRAVENQSLADKIFEQLGAEIVTGRYAPGASLPAERALSEIFRVNRHVVREALKRLEQVGLVAIAQGGSTKVLDYLRHAGLDLLGILSEHARGGEDVAHYWLSILEMRAAVATDVARLCALRGSQAVKDDLRAIARQMSVAADDDVLFALEVRFWERMLDGANNVAYRLAFNSMVKSVGVMGRAAQLWSVNEVRNSGYRVATAAAIARGNAPQAEAVTRKAMRESVEAFAARLPKGAALEPTNRRRTARAERKKAAKR